MFRTFLDSVMKEEKPTEVMAAYLMSKSRYDLPELERQFAMLENFIESKVFATGAAAQVNKLIEFRDLYAARFEKLKKRIF